MKKVNQDALEQMAKEKNIDKNKIEQIASGYKGKSENELMDELIKIGKNLQGKEEVVSKFKAFLDEDQRKKLDTIMGKISEAEVQDKLANKKSKKSHSSNKNNSGVSYNHSHSSQSPSSSSQSSQPKKVKKVVKRVKKSNPNT